MRSIRRAVVHSLSLFPSISLSPTKCVRAVVQPGKPERRGAVRRRPLTRPDRTRPCGRLCPERSCTGRATKVEGPRDGRGAASLRPLTVSSVPKRSCRRPSERAYGGRVTKLFFWTEGSFGPARPGPAQLVLAVSY